MAQSAVLQKAGAISMNQPPKSKPGSVAEIKGTSGKAVLFLFAGTAIARNAPSQISDSTTEIENTPTSVRPAIVSWTPLWMLG